MKRAAALALASVLFSPQPAPIPQTRLSQTRFLGTASTSTSFRMPKNAENTEGRLVFRPWHR